MGVLVEFMRELRDETGAAVAFVQHQGHQGDHMRGRATSSQRGRPVCAGSEKARRVVQVEIEHRLEKHDRGEILGLRPVGQAAEEVVVDRLCVTLVKLGERPSSPLALACKRDSSLAL